MRDDLSLTVDPDDAVPPYEQLRRRLHDLIAVGRLAPGDRLPPLRQLAGDLGLAVGTVARTYRELEGEGLLVSHRGGGTRVAERPAAVGPETALARIAGDYVARARTLDFDDAAIVDAVRRAVDEAPEHRG